MRTTLTDAWHTLVPPGGDRDGPLAPLLLVLTVVAGVVDSFSYLVLGQVFVANMTGNVVFLALALVGAKGFAVVPHLLALVAFSCGAVLSGRVVARSGPRRGRLLAASTAVEVLLVAAALAVALAAADPGRGAARDLLVVLLSAACGLQTGTAGRLAVPDLITTVLTRTIAFASFQSRLAGGDDSRAGRRGLAVASMFGGALVGASLVLHVDKPLALLVVLGLLVTVTVSAGRLARHRPTWDRPI